MFRALGNGGALAKALSALDPSWPPPPLYCIPPEWELDIFSLLLGTLVGLLVYPLAEALLAFRWLVQRSIVAAAQERQRPRQLYRIIAEAPPNCSNCIRKWEL